MITKSRFFINYSEKQPSSELKRLLDRLRADKINVFDDDNPLWKQYIAVFEITDANENYEEQHLIVEQIKSLAGVKTMEQHTLSFSEEELIAASYLSIRSVYAGFHCENQYLSTIHESSHFYEFGGKHFKQYEHLVQTERPQTRKAPVWRGSRQFCSNYDSTMIQLFCSDIAKSIVESSGLRGARFDPVIHARTKEHIKDLWQLWPNECEDFLIPGEGLKTWICPVCGARRYITTTDARKSRIKLNKRALPADLDFLQSPPLVGAQLGYPYYVISAKAYRVLKRHHISRDLVFQPLEVVEYE